MRSFGSADGGKQRQMAATMKHTETIARVVTSEKTTKENLLPSGGMPINHSGAVIAPTEAIAARQIKKNRIVSLPSIMLNI